MFIETTEANLIQIWYSYLCIMMDPCKCQIENKNRKNLGMENVLILINEPLNIGPYIFFNLIYQFIKYIFTRIDFDCS